MVALGNLNKRDFGNAGKNPWRVSYFTIIFFPLFFNYIISLPVSNA
jgi:hypothetical protein